MAFFCLFLIAGHIWTCWLLVGTSGICLPALLLMKERYNRLDVDDVTTVITVDEQTGIIQTPEIETADDTSRAKHSA